MPPCHSSFHNRLSSGLHIITLVFFLLLSAHSAVAAQEHTAAAPKKVLIIHSFHKGLAWTDGIEKGIRSILKESPDTRIYTEYLDSKRHDLAMVQGPFARYLRSKYQNFSPDIIIVSGDNALTFLHGEPVEDFIGVPVSFCAVEKPDKDRLQEISPHITGTAVTISPVETIRIIERLQPQNRRLFIISGAGPSAQRQRKQTEQALHPFTQKIELVWWNNLAKPELIKKLATLDKNDAVLLLDYSHAPQGNSYSPEESARFIVSATNAPVYGLWDYYLGTGVVGGRMASSEKQGQTAAILAKRYLNTALLQDIVQNSPNENMFDISALQTHGIDLTNLPGDARISGAPLVSQTRLFISIAAALFIALLAAFLIYILKSLFNYKTRLVKFISRSVLFISSSFMLCLLIIIIVGKYVEYQRSISFYYEQLLETKRQTLIMMVGQAVNLVEQGKKQTYIPEDQLKQKLLQQITAFSFLENAGYLFVLDYSGTILAHGVDPRNIGSNALMVKDPDGIYPAREVIRIAQQTNGDFISYRWPKPQGKQPIPKLTYAKGIQDWKWAIACGLYLDDIKSLVAKEREKQNQFFLKELSFYLIIGIFGLLFLSIVSRRLSQQIQKEITSLEMGLHDQDEKSSNLQSGKYKILEFNTIASRVRAAFSDLARANARLRANEQQFINALHSSPDAMLLIDEEKVVDCNRPAAEMLGYKNPEELLNLHPSQISPPLQPDGQQSAKKAGEIIATTISQGTNRFEWVHLRKSGTPITIEVTLTLSPVTVTDSRTLLQCVWRDLTLEKELSRQMQEVEKQRKISLETSEQMNRLMSGREERIIEIKKEVNALLLELGRKAKYGRNSDIAAVSLDEEKKHDEDTQS